MNVAAYLNKEETKEACNILDCKESEISKVVKAIITGKKGSNYYRSFGALDIQDIASVYNVIHSLKDPFILNKLLTIGVDEERAKQIKALIESTDLDAEIKKPTKTEAINSPAAAH